MLVSMLNGWVTEVTPTNLVIFKQSNGTFNTYAVVPRRKNLTYAVVLRPKTFNFNAKIQLNTGFQMIRS